MENDWFIIGIVFCKSLMAVGSAGHRYGGTRGASKTCRASNTSDHDFDAVASNMDIDSCSCCLHSWERACQNCLLHSWNGGDALVLAHCFQTFPTVTLLRMLGATSGSHARPPPIHHPFPQNPCKFKAEWREKNIIHRFRRIPSKYSQNTRKIPANWFTGFDGILLFVLHFHIWFVGVFAISPFPGSVRPFVEQFNVTSPCVVFIYATVQWPCQFACVFVLVMPCLRSCQSLYPFIAAKHISINCSGGYYYTRVAAELFCQNANITLVDPITPNKTSAIHLVPMMNIKPRYLS